MKKIIILLWAMFVVNIWGNAQTSLPVDKWFYIEIDSTRETYGVGRYGWLRPFGLDVADVNKDGYCDILSGWYLYLNPGGDMSGKWERKDFPIKADGVAFVDVDNDQFVDIIAQELPSVYWIEAKDTQFSDWTMTKIADIPKCQDMNSQGYKVADMVPGGKPEILMATVEGVHMIEIPDHPEKDEWTVLKITNSTSDEGIAIGDIDNDGMPDIVCGDIPEEDEEGKATLLFWYKNPGAQAGCWHPSMAGFTQYPIDRVSVADFNNDGSLEAVVTEERWNVIKPFAGVYVFRVSEKGINELWKRQRQPNHYSLNSLDTGDLDNDGDIDIVVTEHKGPDLKTYAYINNGLGKFEEVTIFKGMEMHLGTKLVDLDNDGDLDIIGPSWDKSNVFNLLRNDAIVK